MEVFQRYPVSSRRLFVHRLSDDLFHLHLEEHLTAVVDQASALAALSIEDVKKHADGILQRLRNGSMPCDGAWPQEKVETFQRRVGSGMQE